MLQYDAWLTMLEQRNSSCCAAWLITGKVSLVVTVLGAGRPSVDGRRVEISEPDGH